MYLWVYLFRYLFWSVMNTAIINAYILLMESFKPLTLARSKITPLRFRLEHCDQLTADYPVSEPEEGCTNHPAREHSCPWPYLYRWEEEDVRQLLPVKETHTIWPWYWDTFSVRYLFCTSVPCWMPGGVPHQTPGSSWCGVNRVSNCFPLNRTQC